MRRGGLAASVRAAFPALGLAAALLGAPLQGYTQSSPAHEPKAAAQALFDEAMTLRKKGAWSDACSRLDESLRLDPAPGTKFYLAECLEKTGKLASAWLLYTEVADLMASTGQQKRETFARERAAALSTRVARLQVVVPDAARVPGLVVRRDGVVLGEPQWGFASPVDLGPHTIEATAPDRAPFSRTVDLLEGGKTVTVELPPWPRPAPVATAAPTGTAAPVVPASEPGRLPFSLRTAGLVLGGVGLAGAGVGAALGSLAISRQAESNRGPCDAARDVCSPEGLALRADAMTAATGSTVSFVTAGVLFAAGVVLVLWPASPALAAAKGAAGSEVALSLHPGGLSLEGRW